MKKRIAKIGIPLLLVAVLVAAGVYPVTSSQAAAKTVYNVTLLKGSATASIVSINDGAAAATGASLEGTTFQLIVEGKTKTEKVKSTGATAEYYPVTLPKKSFKSPKSEFPNMSGGGTTVKSSYMKADAKGKLYVSGGDVDITVIRGEKKETYKYGDGQADPKGSLFLTLTLVSALSDKNTGAKLQDVPQLVNLTTGTTSLTVQNVKGGLNGKELPKNALSTKLVSDPMTGKVIDLDAGTGTLVATSGAMNGKNKTMGLIDNVTAQVWVMKITK